MADERFPLAPNDLRNTLARAVAPMVTKAALAMIQAARLVFEFQGHDGRGSGSDEWELSVMVPTAAAGTIDEMDALKAAIIETVNRLIPQRHHIVNVLVVESVPPVTKHVKGFAGLAEALANDDQGVDVWEGTLDQRDFDIAALAERYEEVDALRQFLRAFPDAVVHVRQGRMSKGNALLARPPYPLADEYDVQDILWFALRMQYRKARREDPTRKSAGSSSRIDFTVGAFPFAIEVKFLREDARLVELKRQLLQDLHDTASGSDITDLFCFLVETTAGTGQELEQLDGKVDGRTTLHIVRVGI